MPQRAARSAPVSPFSASKTTACLVSVFLDVGRLHVVEQRRLALAPRGSLHFHPALEFFRDHGRKLHRASGSPRRAAVKSADGAVTCDNFIGPRRPCQHRLLGDLFEIAFRHRPRPPLSRSGCFVFLISRTRRLPASSTAPAMPFTSKKASSFSSFWLVSVIALPSSSAIS